MSTRPTAVSILGELSGVRFRFTDESELQAGIALALDRARIGYEREKVLSAADRPDFMIDGRIAVEVKIKGTLAQALRQVARYAAHSLVEEIVLVGTPGWMTRIPPTVAGKPVYSYRLVGSLL